MAANDLRPYGFFGLFWRLAAAAVLVLSLSGAGGYMAVRYLVVTPEVETPDLLTLELTEALEKASDDGFSVRLDKHEASVLLESGHVLAQRPAPGTTAKMGATIRVTVATRP